MCLSRFKWLGFKCPNAVATQLEKSHLDFRVMFQVMFYNKLLLSFFMCTTTLIACVSVYSDMPHSPGSLEFWNSRYMPARSDRRRSQEQLGVYGNRDNGSFPVCIFTWTFFWYRCVCSILLPITAGIWKYTINFLCAQKKERNAFVSSYSSKIWLIVFFWMSFCL